jgi:rod shape determining protein RodA
MTFLRILTKDLGLTLAILLLLITSLLVLRSIAPFVFPLYYFYFIVGIGIFILFSLADFDILSLFHWQLYVCCIIFLVIPLIIGQVTRGAVRWIPIGPITLQPSEIVRPFLFLFFANFVHAKHMDFRRFLYGVLIVGFPLLLILIQPSLGVTLLTAIGFFGILLSSSFSKRTLGALIFAGVVSIPLIWLALAPYQKQRIVSFLSPQSDPTGAGYNSLQSMISVGSGKLWGRGLGEGVQTQLSFLPERHTDFIFASIAEELGFIGACFLLISSFFMLFRLTEIAKFTKSTVARSFVAGTFLSLFVQTMINVGMNMGMLPITGVPLPLVSAGGSSLLATMITLGMVVSTKKMR